MNEKTLHKISYGIYIICSINDGKKNGQIANALFQVTATPQVIAVSINKKNLTHEFITKSKVFTVSILDEQTPMTLIGTFGFKSGKDTDKFKEVSYKIGKTKAPIVLQNTIAYIETKVIDKIDVGTHTIFIGSVEDSDIVSTNRPMTYEYYHKVKGGYSPKNAPTYSGSSDKKTIQKKEEKNMEKYVCTVCGYVYDPEAGDPDNGVAQGTTFEDIPKDWVCPVCGAGKTAFTIEE